MNKNRNEELDDYDLVNYQNMNNNSVRATLTHRNNELVDNNINQTPNIKSDSNSNFNDIDLTNTNDCNLESSFTSFKPINSNKHYNEDIPINPTNISNNYSNLNNYSNSPIFNIINNNNINYEQINVENNNSDDNTNNSNYAKNIIEEKIFSEDDTSLNRSNNKNNFNIIKNKQNESSNINKNNNISTNSSIFSLNSNNLVIDINTNNNNFNINNEDEISKIIPNEILNYFNNPQLNKKEGFKKLFMYLSDSLNNQKKLGNSNYFYYNNDLTSDNLLKIYIFIKNIISEEKDYSIINEALFIINLLIVSLPSEAINSIFSELIDFYYDKVTIFELKKNINILFKQILNSNKTLFLENIFCKLQKESVSFEINNYYCSFFKDVINNENNNEIISLISQNYKDELVVLCLDLIQKEKFNESKELMKCIYSNRILCGNKGTFRGYIYEKIGKNKKMYDIIEKIFDEVDGKNKNLNNDNFNQDNIKELEGYFDDLVDNNFENNIKLNKYNKDNNIAEDDNDYDHNILNNYNNLNKIQNNIDNNNNYNNYRNAYIDKNSNTNIGGQYFEQKNNNNNNHYNDNYNYNNTFTTGDFQNYFHYPNAKNMNFNETEYMNNIPNNINNILNKDIKLTKETELSKTNRTSNNNTIKNNFVQPINIAVNNIDSQNSKSNSNSNKNSQSIKKINPNSNNNSNNTSNNNKIIKTQKPIISKKLNPSPGNSNFSSNKNFDYQDCISLINTGKWFDKQESINKLKEELNKNLSKESYLKNNFSDNSKSIPIDSLINLIKEKLKDKQQKLVILIIDLLDVIVTKLQEIFNENYLSFISILLINNLNDNNIQLRFKTSSIIKKILTYNNKDFFISELTDSLKLEKNNMRVELLIIFIDYINFTLDKKNIKATKNFFNILVESLIICLEDKYNRVRNLTEEIIKESIAYVNIQKYYSASKKLYGKVVQDKVDYKINELYGINKNCSIGDNEIDKIPSTVDNSKINKNKKIINLLQENVKNFDDFNKEFVRSKSTDNNKNDKRKANINQINNVNNLKNLNITKKDLDNKKINNVNNDDFKNAFKKYTNFSEIKKNRINRDIKLDKNFLSIKEKSKLLAIKYNNNNNFIADTKPLTQILNAEFINKYFNTNNLKIILTNLTLLLVNNEKNFKEYFLPNIDIFLEFIIRLFEINSSNNYLNEYFNLIDKIYEQIKLKNVNLTSIEYGIIIHSLAYFSKYDKITSELLLKKFLDILGETKFFKELLSYNDFNDKEVQENIINIFRKEFQRGAINITGEFDNMRKLIKLLYNENLKIIAKELFMEIKNTVGEELFSEFVQKLNKQDKNILLTNLGMNDFNNNINNNIEFISNKKKPVNKICIDINDIMKENELITNKSKSKKSNIKKNNTQQNVKDKEIVKKQEILKLENSNNNKDDLDFLSEEFKIAFDREFNNDINNTNKNINDMSVNNVDQNVKKNLNSNYTRNMNINTNPNSNLNQNINKNLIKNSNKNNEFDNINQKLHSENNLNNLLIKSKPISPKISQKNNHISFNSNKNIKTMNIESNKNIAPENSSTKTQILSSENIFELLQNLSNSNPDMEEEFEISDDIIKDLNINEEKITNKLVILSTLKNLFAKNSNNYEINKKSIFDTISYIFEALSNELNIFFNINIIMSSNSKFPSYLYTYISELLNIFRLISNKSEIIVSLKENILNKICIMFLNYLQIDKEEKISQNFSELFNEINKITLNIIYKANRELIIIVLLKLINNFKNESDIALLGINCLVKLIKVTDFKEIRIYRLLDEVIIEVNDEDLMESMCKNKSNELFIKSIKKLLNNMVCVHKEKILKEYQKVIATNGIRDEKVIMWINKILEHISK